MRPTRREFILSSVLAVSAASTSGHASAAVASPNPFPKESDLQPGDLLWPKVPGAFVPYEYNTGLDQGADFARWDAQRKAKVQNLKQNLTLENTAELNTLENLNYSQFRKRYLEGETPGQLTPYSFGDIAAVGHVAIVTTTNGQLSIVEATPPKVVTSSYAEWVKAHPGQVVWQGRLKGVTTEQGATLAAEAPKYLNRPYDFWNFDLGDDTGFYCSKLVWLCVMRSLGFAVDGDADPKRHFWLSPKQVLYSSAVDILLDQGNYTNR